MVVRSHWKDQIRTSHGGPPNMPELARPWSKRNKMDGGMGGAKPAGTGDANQRLLRGRAWGELAGSESPERVLGSRRAPLT